MSSWVKIDEQMRQYSPFLRDNLHIGLTESNNLATAIASEINEVIAKVGLQQIAQLDMVDIHHRFDELRAFQQFMDMDILNNDKTMPKPGLVRAQVITQNYISFVYLKDACFEFLRKKAPCGSTTRKCCKFLTYNPVRAFRNAFAHANWKYNSDYTGLIFWARKGSDPNEPMSRFEVSQRDLGCWQALSRCIAYVFYQEAIEQSGHKE
ncbi:MAG: hypothetical protein AB7F23_00610 [Phycisphaerae bacterium]